MEDIFDIVEELFEGIGSIEYMLDDLAAIFTGGTILLNGVVLLVGLIVGLLAFVAAYVLTAVPYYKMGKKLNYPLAWLAWVPICQPLICTFMMYKFANKEEFVLVKDKYKVQNGLMVMVGYAVVYFFGGAIVTTIIGIASLIPIIGAIIPLVSWVLYLIPGAAMAAVEYVYLRDVLCMFKPDLKQNQTHAFWVSLADCLLTGGWARTVYLWTMLKLAPLPEAPAEEEVVVAEF